MRLQKKNELTLSVFFTPTGVSEMREKSIRRQVTEFLKDMEIDKIYLATVGSEYLEYGAVKQIKEHFLGKGFMVAGGQIPLRYGRSMFAEQIDYAGRKLGKPCLSDPRNRRPIIKSFTEVAKHFEEYILDDHFYIDCYCDRCIDLFNKKYHHGVTRESLTRMIFNSEERYKIVADFIRFRQAQLIDCVKNLCVEPSRKINPEVQMIFKAAEWYERYRFRGMHMPQIGKYFNQICIGTESRELTERYGSYFMVRYNKSMCGDKIVDRAWIDDLGGYNYAMPIETGGYVDIARCSVLAGIEELVLWCYPNLYKPDRQEVMSHFKSAIPELKDLYTMVHKTQPYSLPVITSDNPRTVFSAETYIFDILGGLGIPLDPVTSVKSSKKTTFPSPFSKQIKSLLLPAHGMQEKFKKPIIEFVNQGGRLIVTSESARMLAHQVWGKEGFDLLGISKDTPEEGIEKATQITAFAYAKDKSTLFPVNHRRCSSAPVRPVFKLGKAKPILLGFSREEFIPVAFENRVGKGTVLVFCLTDYPPYLKNYYPEHIRDYMREMVFTGIGIRTKALGRASTSIGNFAEEGYQDSIAIFPYTDNHLAILNLHHVSFDTEIHIGEYFAKPKSTRIISLLTKKVYHLEKQKDRWVIKVHLKPHQLELIKVQ